MWRAACALLIALLVAASAWAQVVVVHNGELALEFPSARHPGASWFVEYRTYAQEPAFRAAVHHFHAPCDGYLYVTPTRLVYLPVFSPEQKDSFDAPANQVRNVRERFSGIEFRAGDRVQKFAFLTDHGSIAAPREQDARPALGDFFKLAVIDFASAQSKLAAMALAHGNAAEQSPAGKSAPSAIPLIRILAPPGASESKLVDAGMTELRILGVAAAPSAVRAVTINNAAATLRPLSANVIEFESEPIEFSAEVIPVNVALAFAGGDAQLNFKVRKPRIQWTRIPLETTHSKYTLDGRVVGYGAVRAVEVSGHPATLRVHPDGTIDFVVSDLPLRAGENVLEGIVVTAQGERETFPVKIERFRRLNLQDVKAGLHKLPRRRLVDLITERGVEFPLDAATEKDLRESGADKEVLRALAEADRD